MWCWWATFVRRNHEEQERGRTGCGAAGSLLGICRLIHPGQLFDWFVWLRWRGEPSPEKDPDLPLDVHSTWNQNFSCLHTVFRLNVFDRYPIYALVWCREQMTLPDISKERNTDAVLWNGFGSNNCQKFTDNSQMQSKYSAWHCFLPRKKMTPHSARQRSALRAVYMQDDSQKAQRQDCKRVKVTHSGIERDLGVEQLLLKQEVRLWWTITE